MPTESSVGIEINKDSLLKIDITRLRDSVLQEHDSSWVDLKILLPTAKFDIRYADTLNFMKIKIYECPACFTRLVVAKSLINASEGLDSLGLGFIFYDCYRPSSAQWKLWEKMPDARYVHPPKLGSRHSRGVAVDLSLYNLKTDQILDMGTEFDYFGKEAWWTYKGHSEIVNKNRQTLLTVMKQNNFTIVQNEWWHFDFRNQQFSLSDFRWNCP